MTDVVVTLGGWVRDRPEFVLGTPRAGSAAIWRRRDLDAYRGGLRRIAPLLSVEVSGLGETEQELCEAAACARAAGVGVVWLVLPEASGVLVVASQASGRYGVGDVLPEPLGLIGLSPPVNALLRQRP